MDIHRCRFVPYTPAAINALAFSQNAGKHASSLRLAVGRENGNIEIWNPAKGDWVHETTLWGGRGRSIQGLAWTSDQDFDAIEDDGVDAAHRKNKSRSKGKARLFSIGDNNAVAEWDLCTGRPKRHIPVDEVWCIAAQPAQKISSKKRKRDSDVLDTTSTQHTSQNIVAGCGDGSIILLSTEDDNLVFKKIIARASKNKVRVLSIAWHDRNTIVAGMADSSIRVYDIRTNHNMRTMSVGTQGKGAPKESLVWAIECLKDGTIVSGDSSGTVTFWDGRTYSQLQKIKSHEADVLCLTSSADGLTVFSAGMDRKLASYAFEVAGDSQLRRWVKSSHRQIHEHDIKTMARFENNKMSVVASGGRDTQLSIAPIKNFTTEYHRKLPPVPQMIPVTGSGRKIASWLDGELAIWDVYIPESVEEMGTTVRPQYRTLVQMAMRSEEHITSASMSNDNQLLAIATLAEVKVFSLQTKASGKMRVRKLEIPSKLASLGARLVLFSPDSKWLLIVTSASTVHLSQIENTLDGLSASSFSGHIINLKRRRSSSTSRLVPGFEDTISRAAFSSDSCLLALSSISGHVFGYSLSSSQGIQTNGVAHHDSSSEEDPDSSDPEDASASNSISRARPWQPLSAPLPVFDSMPIILTFRPSTQNLLILTRKHTISEYHLPTSSLTSWSRRNPSSALPQEFKLQRDRAIGALWDSLNRLWLYGATWLAMLDVRRDFPRPVGVEPPTAVVPSGERWTKGAASRERDALRRRKARRDTAGAGSKMRFDERTGEWSKMENGGSQSSDEDEEEDLKEDVKRLDDTRLRHAEDTDTSPQEAAETKNFYITHRYQPILGIIPLSTERPSEPKLNGVAKLTDPEAGADISMHDEDDVYPNHSTGNDDDLPAALEVALIERPPWDLDLPPRFVTRQDNR